MASGGSRKGQPDWSALPDLTLGAIAQRLHTLMDFFSFRGVCVSWRSVGRAVAGDVMASHPPLFFAHFFLNRFYHPAENRVYWKPPAVGPSIAGFSHGHFILGLGRALWLSNHLTGAQIHRFPELARPLSRAILSSPPSSPGCVLVACDLYGVQYCRPGDEDWCVVHRPRDRAGNPVCDVDGVSIVGEKGYVLLRKQGLATFDFTAHPELTILTAEPMPLPGRGRQSSYAFLAESMGELFAFSIVRLHSGGDQFVVCRFDPLSCKWARSEDLGGRAVFVDRRRGCVFVDNYAKWGGSRDCIYYFSSRQSLVLEYRLKDGSCKPFLLPAESPAVGGFDGGWVLPSFVLIPPAEQNLV